MEMEDYKQMGVHLKDIYHKLLDLGDMEDMANFKPRKDAINHIIELRSKLEDVMLKDHPDLDDRFTKVFFGSSDDQE